VNIKISFILLFFILSSSFPALSENVNESKKTEEEKMKIILMSPKYVEGEIDKPAVIIIPRANIIEEDLKHKSFHNDLMRDLYLNTRTDSETIDTDRERHW
jgi:hypothetical protein